MTYNVHFRVYGIPHCWTSAQLVLQFHHACSVNSGPQNSLLKVQERT